MLMSQAADAIEELSAKYQMALSDLVRQAKPHEQTIDAEQLKKALDYYIRSKPTIIPSSEECE